MPVTGMEHFTILTSALDETLDFYREHLGLEPGDRIKFFVHPDGSVVLLPKLPASALRGIVTPPKGRTVTIEDMSKAAIAGAAAEVRRRRR